MTDRRGGRLAADSDPFASFRDPGADWSQGEQSHDLDSWADPGEPEPRPDVPVHRPPASVFAPPRSVSIPPTAPVPPDEPGPAGSPTSAPVPGSRRARRLAEAAARGGVAADVTVDERPPGGVGRPSSDHDRRSDLTDHVWHGHEDRTFGQDADEADTIQHSAVRVDPHDDEYRLDQRGFDDPRYDQHEYAQDHSYGPDGGYGHENGYEYGGYEAYGPGDDLPSGASRVTGRSRGGRRFLVFLLILAILGVGGYGAWIGLRPVIDDIRAAMAPAEDFTGPATGETTVTIEQGSSGRAIGQTLVDAGVVASVGAFVSAAEANPSGASIQAGTYTLPTGIPAADAVAAMLDGSAQVRDLLTIPEGQIVAQSVEDVATYRGVTVQEAQAALDQVTLPASAQGNPEGYLYPNSYEFGPDVTLVEIFQTMVDEGNGARALLGIPVESERELIIKASIAEAEGREQDFGNVVSVINNRLAGEVTRVSTLGMDSTCRYLTIRDGLPLGQCLNDESNPYNTRDNQGLPPTPINSPGMLALQAAVTPPDTNFGYFVTVDLNTRETIFVETIDEFEVLARQFQDWCEANGEPEGC